MNKLLVMCIVKYREATFNVTNIFSFNINGVQIKWNPHIAVFEIPCVVFNRNKRDKCPNVYMKIYLQGNLILQHLKHQLLYFFLYIPIVFIVFM